MKIVIINGPSINMLGIREPDIYGNTSYSELCDELTVYCDGKGIDCEIYQSNHEGDLVDKIQECVCNTDGIIINPAAYTHTSIALLDALKAVCIPTVEVHISNPELREEFRKTDYVKLACEKSFAGLGVKGYFAAVDYLFELLK